MNRAESDLVSFKRLFDDGQVVLWQEDAREDGEPDRYGIVTIICTSSNCPCCEIELEVHRVNSSASGEIFPPGPPILTVTLDLPSGEVSTKDTFEEGSPGAAVLASLKARLRGSLLEFFRARWLRAKHQDDSDEWRHVDWSRIDLDAMVPFFDVFPSRWDLCVVKDGKLYWAVDNWCLKAGCPCTDVVIHFISEATGPAGSVQLDTRTGRPNGPNTDQRGLAFWGELEAEPGIRKELRRRRDVIRRVAQKLPALHGATTTVGPTTTTVVRTTKVGRNDPCPCGSGKKSKRCCG